MRLDATGWARRALTAADLIGVIHEAEPRNAILEVGKTDRGWTARVMPPSRDRYLAETYGHLTAEGAVVAVLASGLVAK